MLEKHWGGPQTERLQKGGDSSSERRSSRTEGRREGPPAEKVERAAVFKFLPLAHFRPFS